MRHVLEKLNYANRSMKHKLLLYMAAMGLLLAAVLLVSLQIFGRINTPGEELSKSMSIQMEVFRSDMASLWRNVSGMSAHLSKDMTDILEDTLAEQGMTFSELDGNLDAISQVEEALLEPLCQYARQTDCSGAFVILEAAIGVSSGEADRSGLYVQRSNAEHLTWGSAALPGHGGDREGARGHAPPEMEPGVQHGDSAGLPAMPCGCGRAGIFRLLPHLGTDHPSRHIGAGRSADHSHGRG